MWGISLGGILSGVAAEQSPPSNAVSPNAGGGGLLISQSGLVSRSATGGCASNAWALRCGLLSLTDGHERPITEGEAIGCFSNDLVEQGTLELAFIVTNNAREKTRFFASVEGVAPGDVC